MACIAEGCPTGLDGLADEYDLVVVGAGLSGFVMAEQAAKQFGMRSLIIDKRDHIGAPAASDAAGTASAPFRHLWYQPWTVPASGSA